MRTLIWSTAAAQRTVVAALTAGALSLGCSSAPGAPTSGPEATPREPDATTDTALRVTVNVDARAETAHLSAVIEGPEVPGGGFGLMFQEQYAFLTLPPPLEGDLVAKSGGRPLTAERTSDGFRYRIGPGADRRVELQWTVGLKHRQDPEVIAATDGYEQPYVNASHGMLFTAALIPIPDFALARCEVSFTGDHAGHVITPWPSHAAGDGVKIYTPTTTDLADDIVLLGPGWSAVEANAGGLVGTFAMVPEALWLTPLVEELLVPIVEAEVGLFDRAPRDRYLFAFGPSSAAPGYGGSPKSGSMTMFVSEELPPVQARRGVAHLVAHEFHHTWARDTCVLEDDLRFVTEGFTDYYAYLVPWRLGFTSNADLHAAFERKLSEAVNALQNFDGSLAGAGGDAFFEGEHAYQSCYSAGLTLALWTDLALRQETDSTLDDWMRSLYNDPTWSGARQPGLKDLEERLAAELPAPFVSALMDAVTRSDPIDWVALFDLVELPLDRRSLIEDFGADSYELSPTVIERLQDPGR